MSLVDRMRKVAEIDVTRFDAIIVAGGQAPMFAFETTTDLQRKFVEFSVTGKVAATLCHGVAILNFAKLPSGEHPAKGRTVTGFANKAFNTTGAENMTDSRYPGGAVFMPVCGDDAEARAQVIALATLIGFDAVDCGDLTAARYLEPFAMTWIHMAIKLGHGRRFAFARLQR